VIRLRRGTAAIDLRGSLFCDAREETGRPLCGIHAAATTRWLQPFEFAPGGQGSRCRAAGDDHCLVRVVLAGESRQASPARGRQPHQPVLTARAGSATVTKATGYE
jgi:hypothetical protein